MIAFRHRGCSSEVIRYIGKDELKVGDILMSKDWELPDGGLITTYIKLKCPDCGVLVGISSYSLEKV